MIVVGLARLPAVKARLASQVPRASDLGWVAVVRTAQCFPEEQFPAQLKLAAQRPPEFPVGACCLSN